MSKFVVHAEVTKFDEGLKSRTSSNVNAVIEADSEQEAREKATYKFEEQARHPLVKDIRVSIDIVNKI